MFYIVIIHFSVNIIETVIPTHFKWSDVNKGNHPEFRHQKIFSTASKVGKHRSLIRTTKPIDFGKKSFYFEAIVCKYDNGSISMGLTTNLETSRNGKFPGWDPCTFGIGSTWNIVPSDVQNILPRYVVNIYCGKRKEVYRRRQTISVGDRIGCKLETTEKDLLIRFVFTINGEPIGEPLFGPQLALFPTIGMNSVGAVIDTEFH